MEYTAPAIPSIIPKKPDRDKPEEPAKVAAKTAQTVKEPAENATQTEELPGYFALSQDFKEDPVHQLVANNLYAILAHERGRPLLQHLQLLPLRELTSQVNHQAAHQVVHRPVNKLVASLSVNHL
ncbi:hypothetical protein DSO57_1034583 [Entomophthora muscae]|uniref:Uncharacterized protein n=1 Tax=Entomophthora muscae TaxID=34485 RepID=A0ACC2SZX6_9FUNG|nr:hypothetical protein DSO57_1034583 [Entomophthora muscae]